jgi:hypothetical protein
MPCHDLNPLDAPTDIAARGDQRLMKLELR